MSYERRKKITVAVYLEPEQKKALDALSKKTRVPAAVYLREGVDMVLKKYKGKLK